MGAVGHRSGSEKMVKLDYVHRKSQVQALGFTPVAVMNFAKCINQCNIYVFRTGVLGLGTMNIFIQTILCCKTLSSAFQEA